MQYVISLFRRSCWWVCLVYGPLAAQDCGDFLFQLSLASYPSGAQYFYTLNQTCPGYLLNIKKEGLVSAAISSTIQLTDEDVISFVKTIERLPTDKLNSVPNPYLADGVLVTYEYVSRQGYRYYGELQFPLLKEEAWLLAQEELWLFMRFFQLIDQHFTREERGALEKGFRVFYRFLPD